MATNDWMNALPNTSEMEDVRLKLTDLYNTIGSAYSDLTNSGREAEAAQLREAADRFAKIGSQYGSNSFARQAALQDLSNKFRVAGQVMESGNMTKKIGEQLSVLNALANVSGSTFSQAMERAKTLQSAEQQAAQNSLNRLSINASIQNAARARANAAKPVPQTRAPAFAAPATDWSKLYSQGQAFNASLNRAGASASAIGGASSMGLSQGSLPWYTGPVTGEKATPAAIAPRDSNNGGGSGGATGGSGESGAVGIGNIGKPRGDIELRTNPQTGKKEWTNLLPETNPMAPTVASAKKKIANAPLTTDTSTLMNQQSWTDQPTAAPLNWLANKVYGNK